jgi:hypothetical protein
MSFSTDYAVALVQFRIPGVNEIPERIRDLGAESAEEREARVARYEAKRPMTTLLERNGASIVRIRRLLEGVGFKLSHAYAHQRRTQETQFKGEKPYTLVTFVFARDGRSDPKLLALFERYAKRRYEYVVARRSDDSGEAMFVMTAKTPASPAAELERIEDEGAESFGLTVTRAVRKEWRNGKMRTTFGPQKIGVGAFEGLAAALKRT